MTALFETEISDIEAAARAHYETMRRRNGGGPYHFATWATWEEACQIPGWRDEQLATMQAAITKLLQRLLGRHKIALLD